VNLREDPREHGWLTLRLRGEVEAIQDALGAASDVDLTVRDRAA
jgi:hypothetical protein